MEKEQGLPPRSFWARMRTKKGPAVSGALLHSHACERRRLQPLKQPGDQNDQQDHSEDRVEHGNLLFGRARHRWPRRACSPARDTL